MINSLLYLTASIPDIIFSVCLCARFQFDPRESHLVAIKCIFTYLKGTTNLGLCYKKSNKHILKGYSDVDFVGDRIERKRTSVGCHFIRANLISWSSKRQEGILDLKFISTEKQLADIFTKPLLEDKFQKNKLLDLKIDEEQQQILYCKSCLTQGSPDHESIQKEPTEASFLVK
ncbi:hypothetical protein CR513_42543, partial [Mucuna pruriens]